MCEYYPQAVTGVVRGEIKTGSLEFQTCDWNDDYHLLRSQLLHRELHREIQGHYPHYYREDRDGRDGGNYHPTPRPTFPPWEFGHYYHSLHHGSGG